MNILLNDKANNADDGIEMFLKGPHINCNSLCQQLNIVKSRNIMHPEKEANMKKLSSN